MKKIKVALAVDVWIKVPANADVAEILDEIGISLPLVQGGATILDWDVDVLNYEVVNPTSSPASGACSMPSCPDDCSCCDAFK